MKKKYNLYYFSPIGLLKIVCDNESVLEVSLQDKKGIETPNKICYLVQQELAKYFENTLQCFLVTVNLEGTCFQKKVWQEISKVPAGQVITYKELAKRINQPTAIRAVANAVGANPILIIIPCHRIIGTDHSITGFSAGLHNKIKLLNLEGNHIKKHVDLKKAVVY